MSDEMWQRRNCPLNVDAPRVRPHTIVLSGPVRTYEDHDPEEERRPVGFAPPTNEHEPLLWQGDQA